MTSCPATEDRPSADGEWGLRSGLLLKILARGGAVSEARLIEDEDGCWTIRLRLIGEKREYLVNKHESDVPKLYKDVGLAIDNIRQDLGYRGAIMLSTDMALRAKV